MSIETDKFDALYKRLKPHGVTMTALLAKAVGAALGRHPVMFACEPARRWWWGAARQGAVARLRGRAWRQRARCPCMHAPAAATHWRACCVCAAPLTAAPQPARLTATASRTTSASTSHSRWRCPTAASSRPCSRTRTRCARARVCVHACMCVCVCACVAVRRQRCGLVWLQHAHAARRVRRAPRGVACPPCWSALCGH
jgi:hypothetical protein